MYNFDPYNVLLAIATNIPVLLMTAFVLQGHIYIFNICFINSVILIIKLYATYMCNISEQFVKFLWIAIQYISLIPIQHLTCEKKWNHH